MGAVSPAAILHKKEYDKNWRSDNRHLVRAAAMRCKHRLDPFVRQLRDRASDLSKHYGLTRANYDSMFAQQKGRCASCDRVPLQSEQVLAVDHCHVDGKIRGLLCFRCNGGLGQAQDSQNICVRAIKYLENDAPQIVQDSLNIRAARRQSHESQSESDLRRNLWRLYRITPAAYQTLVAKNNGLCWICDKKNPSGRRLAVDHDHKSKTVRGVLCGGCNRALGFFQDNPTLIKKAIQYLGRSAILRHEGM